MSLLATVSLDSVLLAGALGLLLAVACGLRAFYAPFGLSFSAWMGWLNLGPSFAWMGDGLVLGTFSIAIVLELLSDKIPAVDHAFDVLHLVLKPVLGTLAGAAILQGPDMSPLLACVIGLGTTGAIAGLTHVTKAGVRVGSSGTTAGTGNPVLSVIEDVLAVVFTVLFAWGAAGA